MDNYRIEMKNIVKVFPPDNVALNHVNFKTGHGEIHSIVGENGAGKSTLMKILYGLETASEGTIFLNGKKCSISSPKDAVAHGIGMVHQEFMLIGEYTVLENIILGCEPVKAGIMLHYQDAQEKIEKIIKKFQFQIDINQKIQEISIAAQQKVEIIKLLYREVDTLILDEPTAVLAPQEVDELFELLFQMKKEGKTILFISHRLDEVMHLSDYITVLRSGQYIWTKKKEEITKKDLVKGMVGRDVVLKVHKEPAVPGKEVLSIKDLIVANKRVSGKNDVDHVSLSVREKEIVGIAGIEGNGQYEVLQAIMGLSPSHGSIKVLEEEINHKSVRDRHSIISYVPQDRKTDGSSLEDTIESNAIMTHHYRNKELSGKSGLLNYKKTRQFAKGIIEKYQVACSGIHTLIGSLSGGNQQKVIIGRELELESRLLVLDQPVRGLDVGSIEYIHKKIVEMRDLGNACLLVSADLDELFSLSDKILVMHKGKLVTEKIPAETTKEEIGEYMLGVKSDIASRKEQL